MSTEYDVRKALEAAEEGLRKQGLKLPDKATIQAYAKSNNMSEAEAIENIEKEFAAIESSAGYDEKIEGQDWAPKSSRSRVLLFRRRYYNWPIWRTGRRRV